MTCFGSKVLRSRKPKEPDNLVEMNQMGGDDCFSRHKGREQVKNKRSKKEHHNLHKGRSYTTLPDKNMKVQSYPKHKSSSAPQTTILRKKADPETVRYFSEIANLFESGGVDLEERPVICSNALEETRGKELELATDTIISHTLQTLLESCDIDQLCCFLNGCGKEFSLIAVDKSGSHVAETALRSLAVHLQDEETQAFVEEALKKICQVVVMNPVDMMCSSYGSHVIRSLLCLCKGVPLDSLQEFHTTKSSRLLAERLKIKLPQSGANHVENLQSGFPHLLKFLVREILRYAKEDLAYLLVNKYSSFVLQVALKLLAGDDDELSYVIRILLCGNKKNVANGKFLETDEVQEILELLKDTAYSHLMEVILEVSPESLFNEILTKIFKGSLFEISSHQCGSFVVQALVSSLRHHGQMGMIWEELDPKIKELLDHGMSGVIASLLATCQQLHTHEEKCCQALAAAVRHSGSDSSSDIVPRILFLENYIFCEDKSSWQWPHGDKMHTLGCLMLQTIFRCSSDIIQPYILSITSMDAEHIFETAKDAGGSRVVESFLCSDASAKQKYKVIAKLRGHFGDLSMHPSSSFTVEKCFTTGNMSHKEVIVSELLTAEDELSKTKHGPYLLKKLDVEGFRKWPEQWKSRLNSKQSAYKEFLDTFGSETKRMKESFLTAAPFHSSSQKSLKHIRDEVNQTLDISMSKLGFSSVKRPKIEKFTGAAATKEQNGQKSIPFISKKGKGRRKPLMGGDDAQLKKEVRSTGNKSKGNSKTDWSSEPLLKKPKRTFLQMHNDIMI